MSKPSNSPREGPKPPASEDYYLNEDGLLVFTASYHLKRGSCCGNGCKHCPYGEVMEAVARVPAKVNVSYRLRRPPGARRLALLLHGYQQAGLASWKRLEAEIPADWAVLAPDAPFPIPELLEAAMPDGSSYRMGYSWYFYDPSTDNYIVDMETALETLEALLEQLGFRSLPMTVIGFSQGGYLAPFLGLRVRSIDSVIGLACRFLEDELAAPLPFKIWQIHGSKDDRVDPVGAERSFEALLARGAQGAFTRLPESGHRIDAPMRARVGEILATIK